MSSKKIQWEPLNIMFIGRSGSGKDTQAELIQKALEERDGKGSVFYVGTGAQLRKAMSVDTITARLIKEKVMEKGDLAPTFLAIWAWAQEFVYNLDEKVHILISGSPRTILEAQVIDNAFPFYGRNKVYPIYLNVSREEATARLKKRIRFDDTDERIKGRMDYFEKWVMPTVEYYRNNFTFPLIEIDGNPHDIEKIHKNICKAIGV